MNLTIGDYMKYAGITIGIVCTLALVSQHPIIILFEIIGAALYFAGKQYV